MNSLDIKYQALLQNIMDEGAVKGDRTGTGTVAVFGREIRHNMAEGFPLLTTKKMYFKGIITELLWMLRGDTNIQWLCQNNCNIWVGDAYKVYCNKWDGRNRNSFTYRVTLENGTIGGATRRFTEKEFIEKIKTDDEFAKKWGDLGRIYGAQWRNWTALDRSEIKLNTYGIDQISNMLDKLKITDMQAEKLLG